MVPSAYTYIIPILFASHLCKIYSCGCAVVKVYLVEVSNMLITDVILTENVINDEEFVQSQLFVATVCTYLIFDPLDNQYEFEYRFPLSEGVSSSGPTLSRSQITSSAHHSD